MKLQFITGIFIILLATCSMQPSTPTDSGMEGQVLIGPACPVIQAGQDCPDQPYQATLTINSLEGKRVTQIQTDEQGQFKVPLTSGSYILHPESPNTLPFANDQIVTVESGRFTTVTISYDSGIR